MPKSKNKYVGEEFPNFSSFFHKDVNPLSGNVKRRYINAPNAEMRKIHLLMVRSIRRLKIPMPNATCGRLGNSAVKNVRRHRKLGHHSFNRYFFLNDIRSAYQAVDLEKMIYVLKQVGLEIDTKGCNGLRDFLERYFFDKKFGGLVTGGPASQDLFNLYCEVLIDCRLRWWCQKYNITYTRYLDDLTFSSFFPIGHKKRRNLRNVILDVGFTLSDKKARLYDLKKNPVTINGVGICLDGRIFLPRNTLRQIRGMIFTELRNPGTIPMAVIHGKMGLLKSLTREDRANNIEGKVFSMYRDLSWRVQEEKINNQV